MTSPKEQLLPCPFCGHASHEVRENGRMWTGQRMSEPVSVSVVHWCPAEPGQPSRFIERVGRDHASAIAAWNRRASPNWWRCDLHGPGKRTAWGCPECVREMREEIARLRAQVAPEVAQPVAHKALTDEEVAGHLRSLGTMTWGDCRNLAEHLRCEGVTIYEGKKPNGGQHG